MNNSDTKILLDDLFADQGADEFRNEAMSSMLGAVRRKRRIRRVQQYSALALVLAGVSIVWLLNRSAPKGQQPVASKPTGYELVTTEAFAAERMVQSQAGSCAITHSRLDGVAVIESMDSGQFVRQLDDDGLLALFAGKTVALVYHGPGEAELVFPGQSASGELPVQ